MAGPSLTMGKFVGERQFSKYRICQFEPEALADFLGIDRLAPQAQLVDFSLPLAI